MLLVQPVQPHLILILLVRDSAGLGCGLGSAFSIDATSEWVVVAEVAAGAAVQHWALPGSCVAQNHWCHTPVHKARLPQLFYCHCM